MGIHIEAQHRDEIIQLRSRELQLENIEKLEQIIPVVNDIENVDLQSIEDNTHQIKTIVEENLDNQVNLDELADVINTINKGIIELKKSTTRLSNSLKETMQKIDELSDKFGDDIDD